MARLIRHAQVWSLAVVSLAIVPALEGCSAPGPDTAEQSSERAGSVGLDLQLAPGQNLNQVAYAIVGPGGFSKSGTVDLSSSTRVSALISGLPQGTGFSITLTGTTVDGSVTCSGSATFNIVAHQTTTAAVSLTCHEAARTGSVHIDGNIQTCPVADGISASPAEALVGSSIALAAAAHVADGSALSYSWTASSGTLDDAASATPRFTCTTPGIVSLSVTVSSSPAAPDCSDTTTASVTCTPTTANVQAIADANCISCHGAVNPPRGLSLIDVRVAIGAPAGGCPQKLRIASGSSAHSYLVDKLLGAAQDGGCFSGRQMPLGKPPLAASDLGVITSWIDAGTP